MRAAFVIMLGLAAGLGLPGAAIGQPQPPAAWGDPCATLARTGNILLDMAAAVGAQQRALACAAKRRAQWDQYNARLRASQEQRAATTAAPPAAIAKPPTAAASAAPPRDSDKTREAAHAKAAAKRQAAARQLAAKEAAERQSQALAAALAEARRRAAEYASLLAAENSPANHCKDPEVARLLLTQWTDFDSAKEAGQKAIDIEHLTTVAFSPDTGFSCHGVFVTNRGLRLLGTMVMKKNVAGDPIFTWSPDAKQDDSLYQLPPLALPPEPPRATVSDKPAADGGSKL
jgi:hypothetical protein